MTARPPVYLVHVAGTPDDEHVQRCVSCSTVLIDNSGWYDGRVAVMDGDDCGPTWWPAGALVATDKAEGGGGSVTYVVQGDAPLDDDERPCVGARG